MIIAMAGLPGVGKTTLAGRLRARIPGALLLSKDDVRTALFGSEHTTYRREQDDHCVQILLDTARWQWRHDPHTTVVLDGRTWLGPGQLTALRAFAHDHQQTLVVVECVCRPDLARTRLAEDYRHGRHPAGNRTPRLHTDLAATAAPITGPKLLVDTEAPASTNVDQILRHLHGTSATTTGPADTEDA